MKIGVSSYCFSRPVRDGKLSQLAVIGAARDLGFECIEFSTLHLPPEQTPVSYAPQLRAEAERHGLPIVNYTIGADFLNGSGGDWKAEAARLQDEVRAAKLLGAPGMRHDATRGFPPAHTGPRSFDDALPTLIQGCRAVTEFAASQGVRTMVENHGFFCQDSARLEKLVNGVNHPNFGLLIDMGNFLCADEDPARAVGRLLPYACHVHAKDFHVKAGTAPHPGRAWFQTRAGNFLRGAILGHGEVPVLACLRLLKKHGYAGVLSIEFEGLEEPGHALALGLENLKRYLAEA